MTAPCWAPMEYFWRPKRTPIKFFFRLFPDCFSKTIVLKAIFITFLHK